MKWTQTSQFKHRLIASSIAIVLLSIIIYYSQVSFLQPIFVLLNATLISLALFEYYQLAAHKGFQPSTSLGIGCTIFYLMSLYLAAQSPDLRILPPFALLISLALFFLAFFDVRPQSLGDLAVTFFGFIYLTIPLSYATQINYLISSETLIDGRPWLTYVILVTKMTDVGAYLVGKTFGKHRLAPRISPKKTIEGALGGIVAAVLTSFLFYLFVGFSGFLIPHLTFWQSLWLPLLLGCFAQFGDLAESVLKRDAGVKDSNQLPGLGGALDMVDSLIFTLPLLYLILESKKAILNI